MSLQNYSKHGVTQLLLFMCITINYNVSCQSSVILYTICTDTLIMTLIHNDADTLIMTPKHNDTNTFTIKCQHIL